MTFFSQSKRSIAVIALSLFAALGGLLSLARADLPVTSRPFVSPKGDYVTDRGRYHTYRIPGMVVAADGTVLLFAEARRGKGSDPRRNDRAPIDIVMRRSTDHGRTWSDLKIVDSGFKATGIQVDFGDPTPVLDRTTGTIHLFYGQWPDHGSVTADVGQDPNSAANNQVVWVRSSTDHGRTWSDRRQIRYPDQPATTPDGLYWRQAEPGPGNGIQLRWQDGPGSKNGRLVIPAKRSGSSQPAGSATVEPFVYFSDDHGDTWQVGNVTPGPNGNEDEVVELADGDLLLDVRQNRGDTRLRHRSSDGGQTWGPNLSDDVAITPVDGSLARYSAIRDGHDRNRILFSGPRGKAGLNRNHITVWTSYDEGVSFINPVQIGSGFAAYSVVQRLADGTIGLAYEGATPDGATYGGVTFHNFNVAQLEGAKFPATLSHYDGFGNQVDPLRGGIGWTGAWDHSGVSVEEGGLEFPGYGTAGDNRQVRLRGVEMTRNLGSHAIDLNRNQDYYLSLFIRQSGTDGEDSTAGSLTIRFLDGSGTPQAAFGVGNTGRCFIQQFGNTVTAESESIERDTTYLLLVKFAAQESSNPHPADRLSLAWYADPNQVPRDPSQIRWPLTGDSAANLDGTIPSIGIAATEGSDWHVDGLRIGTAFDAVIVHTGMATPRVQSMHIENGKAILVFDSHGSPLVSRDRQPLRYFEVAGDDGIFTPAEAHIVETTVEVSNPNVRDQRQVRYAWIPYPEQSVNLFNAAGLPAAPFQIDMDLAQVNLRQRTVPLLVGRGPCPTAQVCLSLTDSLQPIALTELCVDLDPSVDFDAIESVAIYSKAPNDPHQEATRKSIQMDGIPVAMVRFGSPQTPARQTVIRGKQLLQQGPNAFWICLEFKEGIDIGQPVRAGCSSIRLSNRTEKMVPQTPGVPRLQRLGIGLRHAGDNGSQCYRIPGLATTNAGTLLAVYDIRWRGCGDLPGDIDIGLSRSTNGGKSWENMKVVMDMGKDPSWRYDGIGDPSILVDRVTGTIWVAALWSHGNRGWSGSGPGLTPEETGQLMLVKSTDDGRTWSEPINITRQVKEPAWSLLLQGPGKGITMRDGTIVFPAQFQAAPDKKRTPHSTIIYSKDHGTTWHIGTGAFPNTTEAQVVEMEPGVLMLNCRYDLQNRRVVMLTRDLGQTWSEHSSSRKALPEPKSCMASLIDIDREVGADRGGWLLFSNPNADQPPRRNITIKASPDRGKTWPHQYHVLLDEGQCAGYSCMTMIDAETVGILYESSQAHLVFQRIPLSEIIRPQ